jgi:hypothetical protein
MLTLSVDSGNLTTYRYSLSVCFLEIGTNLTKRIGADALTPRCSGLCFSISHSKPGSKTCATTSNKPLRWGSKSIQNWVVEKDAEFATCRVLGSFEEVIQVIETYIFRTHGKGDPPRNALHERVVEAQRELIDRGVIGISSRCKLLERFSWNCSVQRR